MTSSTAKGSPAAWSRWSLLPSKYKEASIPLWIWPPCPLRGATENEHVCGKFRYLAITSVSSWEGESLVKQDSKQVQVDLQDLGYETCGRSENEAEREESTSPGKSMSVGSTFPPWSQSSHLAAVGQSHIRWGGGVRECSRLKGTQDQRGMGSLGKMRLWKSTICFQHNVVFLYMFYLTNY